MSSSKTIGIIGGGQLGQMMAISAIYMGHKVIALDPAADCPASRVAEIIVAPYNDVNALRQLAERCDVLTYELKMSMLTVWMRLSRMDNSLKGQTCFVFPKIASLKRTFSQTRLKSLWHPTRL